MTNRSRRLAESLSGNKDRGSLRSQIATLNGEAARKTGSRVVDCLNEQVARLEIAICDFKFAAAAVRR